MLEKVYPVTRSDAEWRRLLTPDQYDVMRGHGTEAPGSCALLVEKRPGQIKNRRSKLRGIGGRKEADQKNAASCGECVPKEIHLRRL